MLSDFFIRNAYAEEPEKRPNILWLDTEDLSPDLGCYGNTLVKTPNIDQLADEGVKFTNAFVTAPVCSASRSAVVTGMYQTSFGGHHHRSNRDNPLPDNIKHISHYLREAGYFTCNGQVMTDGHQGKLDYNFKMSFDEAFDGTDWSQRKSDQPFFAEVHFNEAHRVFHKDPDNPINPDDVEIPPYYPDHPITRLDWALYLETIQNLDKKIGKVLQRLEDEGLADNTVVFFWGDHGRAMLRGKQFLYDGGIHIPLIVRWPGHIQPGTVRDDLISMVDLAPTWLNIAGAEVPEYMEGQDFLGSDFTEREYIIAARDRCDETDDRIRCVQAKKYKYIRNFHPERPYTYFNAYKKQAYPVLTLMEIMQERGELKPEQARFTAPNRPEEELYDLKNDPHEINNLADDPEHQKILKDLSSKLDSWIKETGDHGEVPEDEDIMAYWDNEAETRFAKNMKSRGLEPDASPEEYLKWWEEELKRMKQ
ncbi:sulfatase-like hydrolase/transferase [Candidatus Poribacteria bacterium]|nr:sulfatase-like hydrolase/transferase [Candidatus Poribacteria bacterium]